MSGPLDPFDDQRPQLPDNSGELTATIRAMKGVLIDHENRIKALEDKVAASLPVTTGMMWPYMGPDASTAPDGTEWCHGQAVSRTDAKYAALFAVIGTTFGDGDGVTTFNLPDGRGVTFRGLDKGAGKDHESNRTVGSYQADTVQEITGSIDMDTTEGRTMLTANQGAFAIANGTGNNPFYLRSAGGSVLRTQLVLDISKVARTSAETVMKNIGGNWVIKL